MSGIELQIEDEDMTDLTVSDDVEKPAESVATPVTAPVDVDQRVVQLMKLFDVPLDLERTFMIACSFTPAHTLLHHQRLRSGSKSGASM